MKKLHLLGSVLLMVSSTLSFTINAEIYTWKDEKGKVHFSDKPILNEETTTIEPKKNSNLSSAGNLNSQWHQDYNTTKKIKSDNAIKNANKKKKDKAYCNNLKSRFAIYDQGGRRYVMSPDGERTYKSEKELVTQKKALAKKIKQKC